MINNVITITTDNYNIQNWEKVIIETCMNDNPSSTQEELANLLGMSERNLYRISKIYNIDTSHEAKQKRYNNMLNNK